MTSELVHRIRTCVAVMLANDKAEIPPVYRDAADLMLEASNRLDVPEDIRGELMAILPGAAAAHPQDLNPYQSIAVNLPKAPIEGIHYSTPPCPECANVSPRTVRRVNRKLIVTCPMCSHAWEYVA